MATRRIRERLRDRISADKPRKTKRVGGFAFFLSYGMLTVLAALNSYLLLHLQDDTALSNWAFCGAGLFIGAWGAVFLVRGRFSVFLHELRHAVLSFLFGNRMKSIEAKRDSGLYTYSYEDPEYNAFIALAPYFLPLFTVIGVAAGLIAAYYRRELAILIASVGYGLDLMLNSRDVHPRQTDISLISGGYLVGVGYILLMNFAIFTYFAAWISQGGFGMKFMFFGLWTVVVQIVAYYQGYPI